MTKGLRYFTVGGIVTVALHANGCDRAQADPVGYQETDSQTPRVIGFSDFLVRATVSGGVEGATKRLRRPRCAQVLADFTDRSGQSLAATLAATGRSPTEAFSRLQFADDSSSPQCERDFQRLAFTQVGSSVIHVCGLRFRLRDWSVRKRMTVEILFIHEFLHTLGLGENPPTSDAITRQVAIRCGG
jgi:hypothetical protein